MGELFTGVHLHLLVNHIPILGSLFALALLITAYFYGGEVLRKTAFVVLVITAFASAAANYTGEPAEDAIRGYPGVIHDVIHEHEELAENAFRAAVIVGILALVTLVRWRRVTTPPAANTVLLVAAVIVSGLMAYTGLLGGRVRHTELRSGSVQADAMIVEPPRRRPPAAQPTVTQP